jgi:HEAT repeat protein
MNGRMRRLGPPAILALMSLGAPAAPVLADSLAHPPLRRHALHALLRLGPKGAAAAQAVASVLQGDPDAGHRGLAATALGEIAGDDPDADLALLDALARDSAAGVRAAAAGSLGRKRQDAGALLPAVVDRLALSLRMDADAAVRRRAAASLGALGKEARAALADLVEASRAGALRITALRAVGRIAEEPGRVLPLLASGLGDPREGVRRAAADAIAAFGPAAGPAVPALVEALERGAPAPGCEEEASMEEEEEEVEDLSYTRVHVLRAIAKAGPAAAPALPALVALWRSAPRPELGAEVLRALVAVGPSWVAVAEMQAGVKGAPRNVRVAACGLLGALRSSDASADAVLRALAEDPDPCVREAALEALGEAKAE